MTPDPTPEQAAFREACRITMKQPVMAAYLRRIATQQSYLSGRTFEHVAWLEGARALAQRIVSEAGE